MAETDISLLVKVLQTAQEVLDEMYKIESGLAKNI